jgi:hypothetical protein
VPRVSLTTVVSLSFHAIYHCFDVPCTLRLLNSSVRTQIAITNGIHVQKESGRVQTAISASVEKRRFDLARIGFRPAYAVFMEKKNSRACDVHCQLCRGTSAI